MKFRIANNPSYRRGFQEFCLNQASPDAIDWYKQLQIIVSEIIEREAAEVDRTREYPLKSVNALKSVGAFGVMAPKELHGLDFGEPMAALIVETVASACPSTAAILMFHYQVIRRILLHGTEKQKKEFVPLLASGKILGASAWSELKAGADKSGILTRLTKSNGSFILNGEKNFCTGLEGVGVIHALVGYPDEDGSFVPTFVSLLTAHRAITLEPMKDLMGLRASSTGTIRIKNYRVVESDIIGGPGNGIDLMRSNHRFLMNPGLLSLGIARRIYEESKLAVTGYWPHMRKTTIYQNTRFKLSDIEVKLSASYALATAALNLGQQGAENINIEYCKVKVNATEMAVDVASMGMQLIGARSFSSTWPMERFFRESRAALLMGPTNEIIKEWISTQLIKEIENTNAYATKVK